MENRPPQQETPRRPPTNTTRKPNGSGGSPTPPWLWLLLLGGFALIFWQFVPKTEVSVLYYPWFYEQVERDNIKSVTIQGTEIRGELRKEDTYQNSATQTTVPVHRMHFGSWMLWPGRGRPATFMAASSRGEQSSRMA